jgi:hypothetical protein
MHQETTMEEKPLKEHQWLEKLLGEWTYETEAAMEPGKPPEKFSGTETVRSIGGFWIVCEGRGIMPEVGMATTIMTLGYNPLKKRYTGTFIGSMMSHMWLYDGALNPAGKVLRLDTVGPSFTEEGKMVKYQDVIEIVDDDHRMLSSGTIGDDGKWHKFMSVTYRRAK